MLILAFLLLAIGAAVVYVRCCGFVMWKAALLFAACFVALNLFYLVIAWVVSWFINPSKPLSRQSFVCRSACVYASFLVTGYCWVKTHVRGAEKLPETGRFLLVSNHRSGFDPIVITRMLRRFNISFVSKPSNLQMPFLGRVGYGTGCLPIDRENDRKALTTILTAADYLKRNLCSMAIYPEGSRSRDGQLQPFHPGSFKIAQKANVPLVITSISGTENVGKNVLRRPTDVYLDILEVIPAEQVKAMSTRELAEYSSRVIAENLNAVPA
ncbi:MAG: 1-acyl-sn-glycerol-3-phosphate acyltransferase [Candidatus Limivicinus sp.]